MSKVSRRKILKAAATAVVLPKTLPVLAKSQETDYRTLVPADKKLDPKWIASLTARGEEPWITGSDLRYIGMPVGGLFAGCVYLSGDGRLWNWDVYGNRQFGIGPRENTTYNGESLHAGSGANYVDPIQPTEELPVRVALIVNGKIYNLDASGFENVKFLGKYPVGIVRYSHPGLPVEVELNAFTPFIPLDVENSSYPASILEYKVQNLTNKVQEVAFVATVRNPVLERSRKQIPNIKLAAKPKSLTSSFAAVMFSGELIPSATNRPDILFDDFEGTYAKWKVTGDAFGKEPFARKDMAGYHNVSNHQGTKLVNGHNTRTGLDIVGADNLLGKMVSIDFKIERNYINFRIGGGNHPDKTCMNLVVDGKVARTITGHDSNAMRLDHWDVRELIGKTAHLEIVDEQTGGWGHISIDEIIFSDQPRIVGEFQSLPDYGNFAVSFMDRRANFDPVTHQLRTTPFRIPARKSAKATVGVAWYFPNVEMGLPDMKQWYSSRFKDAADVLKAILSKKKYLSETTKKWANTWYGGTLPWWFLQRTMIPTDALQTKTSLRFANGRFWFWEGVGCCEGTCTHVWGYAQAIGRLFPEIERRLRTEIDYGQSFHAETGAIDYRGEFAKSVAHDGQCGCILRAYREHTTSENNSYLKKTWPQIKRSVEYMLSQDPDRNGLLDGEQYNTLDASWWGPMGWMSGLYLAAVRAGSAMASEMGELDFAKECEAIVTKGQKSLKQQLFNGEFFIHLHNKAHDTNNTNFGCHIDQVYGQAWAHQVGLGYVMPKDEVKKSLQSLWKYNFAPDIGVYRRGMKVIKGGRWYAVAGEAGLLMTTFPKGGAEKSYGHNDAWAAMYFNECMSGFEHQVAAHMLAEGMITEGLAITRSIHDRYAAHKRNPYNEIECSDHYGRAMAAFGSYITALGFTCHGPKGEIGFDPKISPEKFKSAFIAGTAWGLYEQQIHARSMEVQITCLHGALNLKQIRLPAFPKAKSVTVNGKSVKFDSGNRITVHLNKPTKFSKNESLTVVITS